MRRNCSKKPALAMGLVMAMAFSMTAAAAVTQQQAQDTAAEYVPEGSACRWTENDGGRYEVLFYNESRKERYEVKVDRESGKITEFESELAVHDGSTEVKVSEAEASQAVTAENEGAEILSVNLDRDDGLMEYEVRFQTDRYYGTYDIHPVSGAVLKRDIKIGTPPSSRPNTAPEGILSVQQAAQKAQEALPGCRVADVDLDWENGSFVYEVEAYKDGIEYNLVLDAATGALMEQRQEYYGDGWKEPEKGEHRQSEPSFENGRETISVEQAKQIALDRAPGAVISKIELDYEDGRMVYEGEMYKEGWEYEFQIDAVSGEVTGWEQEYDD